MKKHLATLALSASTTILSLPGHPAYMITFSTTPVIRAYGRVRRWIQDASGAIFVIASYRLATVRV